MKHRDAFIIWGLVVLGAILVGVWKFKLLMDLLSTN